MTILAQHKRPDNGSILAEIPGDPPGTHPATAHIVTGPSAAAEPTARTATLMLASTPVLMLALSLTLFAFGLPMAAELMPTGM